ncbi:unnamed protein product, partial [Rotaria magnacalcarata]
MVPESLFNLCLPAKLDIYSKSLIYIIGNGTQIEKFPLNDIAILSCTCTLRSLFLTVKNKYELSNV